VKGQGQAARIIAMALNLDTIRATADRVAASHHLEVVDLEFQGRAKFRTLRVFIEKDAEERAKLATKATEEGTEEGSSLPKGVPVEMLSGVTHEDCTAFAQDFGTVLDVEDLMPGAEYTLEVSSPGLERKLFRPEDYTRFTGSLIKVQTFTPLNNNRNWQGRLTGFSGDVLTLDLSAVKQKGKARKAATATVVEIPLANVEKAQLVAEF
jgi:ribosome maturation factor RimP